MSFPNPHAAIDRANLNRDRATAAAIRRHPELIQTARENLERWLRQEGESADPVLLEWKDILFFLTPDQLADFLESEAPKANRLRQSSPFAGVLESASHATRTA